jgi:hypothetical protein
VRTGVRTGVRAGGRAGWFTPQVLLFFAAPPSPSRAQRSWAAAALACLGGGLAARQLGVFGGPLCAWPRSPAWQPHSAWHLLTAAAVACCFCAVRCDDALTPPAGGGGGGVAEGGHGSGLCCPAPRIGGASRRSGSHLYGGGGAGGKGAGSTGDAEGDAEAGLALVSLPEAIPAEEGT